MEEKKIITLDLTDCRYLGELHERIRVAFDFPFWYGANWDAFWDLLWSECDADKVIIRGEKTMPDEFDEQLKMMHHMLDKNVAHRERCCRLFEGYRPFSYRIID